MLFYLVLTLIIALLGTILEKKNRKTYSFLVFIILTIVVGLRHYSIGVDTPSYVGIFNQINKIGVSNFTSSWLEPTFLYFNLLISKFTDSYTIFLLIIATITNYSLCKFIEKNSNNLTMSFILIILTRILFNEMNIIRQCLSVALFLMAYDYIKERKFFKFAIITVISSLIHKSSIILIPIYFLYEKEFTAKTKSVLLFITGIIFICLYSFFIKFSSYFGDTYTQYVNSYFGSNKVASILIFFINFLILILFFIINKSQKSKKDYDKDDLFLYNCHYIFTLISLLSIRMSVLSRITIFFDTLLLISIPNYICKIKNWKLRIGVYAVVILLFALSTIIILLYRPEWYKVIPYHFFGT